MKLLKEKYKTFYGAQNRCAFENSLAKGEFERGDKAKLYQYKIGKDENGQWRVIRKEVVR